MGLLDPTYGEVEEAIIKIKEGKDVNVCSKCIHLELAAHDEPCDICCVTYSLKFEEA